MSDYEILRCMLDAHPSGAPPHPAINEILCLLFTEKEVKVAIHMSFKAKSPTDIAKSSGILEEEAKRHLDSMSEKGVIVGHQTKKGMLYRLIPIAEGLCEHSLQKAAENPLHAKLRDLWKQYRDNGMIVSMTDNKVPLMRVLPIEKSLNNSKIFTHEAVSNLINASKTIAVYNCACRIAERQCDAPIETCFVFGSTADFLIDRSFARKITHKEALQILDMTEQAGLLHLGTNSADKKAVSICNCCSCCCLFLRGLLEFGNSNAIASTPFVATVKQEFCANCGTCSERCHVAAITEQNGNVGIQEDTCLGCGLCAISCPEKAIELRRREVSPEVPSNVLDLGMKVLEEKGKLNEFIEILEK